MSLLDLVNKQRSKLQRGNNNRAERLQSGKNLVRILPSWDGTEDGEFSQDWGQHFIKDAAGNLKAVYICSQTNFDEACPICDAIAEGMALTSDEELLKTLKDGRSSKRILVNAMYLKGGKNEKPEEEPVVLELPPTVWDSVLATAHAFLLEGVNVFSPTEGHNFVIEKTGSGMNTEYTVTPSPRASALNPGLVAKAKNLNEWARQESEAEKNKALTSVKVLSGLPGPSAAPRLMPAPAREPSRLSRHDAVDVDDLPLSTAPKLSGSDDLDDFLNDL